jgi:hypothetical protein
VGIQEVDERGIYKSYGRPELKKRSLRVQTGEVATLAIPVELLTFLTHYIDFDE